MSDDWKLSRKCKQPVMLSGAKHLWLFPLGGMHANQKRSEILRCTQNDKAIYEMAAGEPNPAAATTRLRYRS
jgi:hypothetical protein